MNLTRQWRLGIYSTHYRDPIPRFYRLDLGPFWTRAGAERKARLVKSMKGSLCPVYVLHESHPFWKEAV